MYRKLLVPLLLIAVVALGFSVVPAQERMASTMTVHQNAQVSALTNAASITRSENRLTSLHWRTHKLRVAT